MRNLKRVHHARVQIDTALPITATTWDLRDSSVIAALGPCRDSQVIELRRLDPTGGTDTTLWPLIASWDAPCPDPGLACDAIVALHHFAHIGTICLVLAGGDIVVVRESTHAGQDRIEIVGSVDAGITAAVWSPDEEVLAIVTASGTLLFMSADFDVIANANIAPEDATLSKQVNVGWGKAETQFKGKRVKALRDPTVPERVDSGSLSFHDDQSTSVSWRGDGAFVVINSVELGSRRMLRVYSRDGVLESVSEAVDSMEGALSWKPSGQLIASVQRSSRDAQVIFFERNGLRHGEFSLRLTAHDMNTWARSIALSWNPESSALAVCYLDRIQIWTMGNYHYYLKQEIMLEASSNSVPPLSWHPEEGFRILTFSPQRESPRSVSPDNDASSSEDLPAVYVSRLLFDTSGGSYLPPHDFGAVAMIDGKILGITSIRIANMPPPMTLHELELKANAIDVAFNVTNHKIAVLHESTVSLFQSEDYMEEPLLKTTYALPTSRAKIAQQICIRGEDDIFVLFYDLVSGMQDVYHAPSNLSFPVEGSDFVRILVSSDSQMLCLAVGDTVVELDVGVNSAPEVQLSTDSSPICTFPAAAPFVQVQRVNELDVAFGMTLNGTIFANERLLVKNCTSFLVTNSHLLFTTANHLLKFVHLTDISSLEVPADEPEKDERCRSVERGARIVTVMPTTFSVVLQMPRGNLETIFPRALVLAFIRDSIHKKDYKAAFLACRAQRVDMNILYDYAPSLLLSNVGLFIEQLQRQDYIDLFLSQLDEANVTQTMYRQTLPGIPTPDGNQVGINRADEDMSSGPSKINRICDAFLNALKSSQSSSVQNLITANLCKSPPDIEAGLSIIAGMEETQSTKVDTAMEHICFLADVNQIYERALGMYDLRLALLAAQQSQRDPREYLPYLHSLQVLSEIRRKFTIDNDLANFSKALTHLQALSNIDEVRSYVQQHILYTQALELYRYDQGSQELILADYAAYLQCCNQHRSAATAYESLGNYAAASAAYRAANAWRECLSTAGLIPLPRSEMLSLAQALLNDALESKNFEASAVIARDYLQDVSSAARYFCKAYAFSEALRLTSLHQRLGLVTDVIDTGVGEAVGTLTELMADCRSQLEAQVPRLRELRRIKFADPFSFFEGAVNQDIPDNVSVAPSSTSTTANTFMTRYTGATGSVATNATRKTSKNRRREERKRARGKKGSIYEEEYLVSSIGRLIERVNNVRSDVGATIDACLRRGMRERGRALEEATREVVEKCTNVISEVYETDAPSVASIWDADKRTIDRPQGADGVLWDSLQDKAKRVVPVVQGWTGNALLSNAWRTVERTKTP